MSYILSQQLSYQEQLETREWKSRRKEIIERDKHSCLFCGKSKSLRIAFGDNEYYVGIDFSKEKIFPSDYSIIESGIRLSDEIEKWNNHRIKGGSLPGSWQIGVLSAEGIFFYTVWTTNDDYKNVDVKTECYIARLLCSDGYVASVLYTDEDDLYDLVLYRVYVQKEPVTLTVHHKRYILGKQAWEYGDEDLVTLCQHCHSKVHEFLPVQTYAQVKGELKVMNYTPCIRCNGTGYLPEYKHVENGICFRCRGVRFEELIQLEYEDFDDL